MVAASRYSLINEATPLRLKGRRDVWNPALQAFVRRRLARERTGEVDLFGYHDFGEFPDSVD